MLMFAVTFGSGSAHHPVHMMEHPLPTEREPRYASAPRNKPDDLSAICTEIRTMLDQKRIEITNEIRNYRPPIPACDAHFNFLLEERARISHEISCVDELAATDRPANSLELIHAFVNRCAFLDDAAKDTLGRRLTTAR